MQTTAFRKSACRAIKVHRSSSYLDERLEIECHSQSQIRST